MLIQVSGRGVSRMLSELDVPTLDVLTDAIHQSPSGRKPTACPSR